MSGVDAVIAEGYVDEDQLFVTGGSGGGVLSSWIVGKTERFSAAVTIKHSSCERSKRRWCEYPAPHTGSQIVPAG